MNKSFFWFWGEIQPRQIWDPPNCFFWCMNEHYSEQKCSCSIKKNKASALYILYSLRSFDRLTHICWTSIKCLTKVWKVLSHSVLFCLLSGPKLLQNLLQSSIKLFKVATKRDWHPTIHFSTVPSAYYISLSSNSSGLRDTVSAFLSFPPHSSSGSFWLKDGSTRNVSLKKQWVEDGLQFILQKQRW